MLKPCSMLVVVLLSMGLFSPQVSSSLLPQTLMPGMHRLEIAVTTDPSPLQYQIWSFQDHPIELIFSNLSATTTVQFEESIVEELARFDGRVIFSVQSPANGFIRFWLKDQQNGSCQLNWKYQDPHQAFLGFARMYAQYSYPWHRRAYLDYYISPIPGNQQKYPLSWYRRPYPVTLGAPYSWGGKQSLSVIHSKLIRNGPVAHWMEYYEHKDRRHPVNLDADESCFDPRPGPENPDYWAGVDCSGLLENACARAGLAYNWREAELISIGDYRSASNFFQIRPGDIFILRRDGIVVHFGVISRKGPSIATSWMIHSAWFTSFRYNTNGLLRVSETSLGEFRSFYTWEIRRYRVR